MMLHSINEILLSRNSKFVIFFLSGGNKTNTQKKNYCYSLTLVAQGLEPNICQMLYT